MPEFVFSVGWIALGVYLLVICDHTMPKSTLSIFGNSLIRAVMGAVLWPLAVLSIAARHWVGLRIDRRAQIL
jgi:hypothetical protein